MKYRWSGVVDSRYKVKATATISDEKLRNYTAYQEPVSTRIMGEHGVLNKCECDTSFTVYIMDGDRAIVFIHAHEVAE